MARPTVHRPGTHILIAISGAWWRLVALPMTVWFVVEFDEAIRRSRQASTPSR